MKIEKAKWQEWAAMFADQETNDFVSEVPLTLEQVTILRAKIEAGVFCGMDLILSMIEQGADVSEAKDLKPALVRLSKHKT